ncbi:pikAI [Symbiodinium microadriaticum]|nr:pikAI [Symbiodinium microadriaticum]
MAVLAVLQALAKSKGSLPELWISTFCCQWAKAGDFQGQPLPLHSAIWGLARAARNELPNLRLFCADAADAPGASSLPSVLGALEAQFGSEGGEPAEHERALRGPQPVLYVPRLQEASLTSSASDWAGRQGLTLITGGLGALGLCFAQWLLENKGAVALVSRTGRAAADCQVAFRRVASKVTVHRADLAKADDTKKLFQQPLFKDLRGIIHAAGLLEDHMIVDLTREHFERPLAAKIDGTLNLNEGLSDQKLDLEFFALFSSVAALLGTPAQGNYCAGNAFLDSFAAHCRDNGRKAVSIQWGPWAEVGMAARANTSESSIARLSPAKGIEAMHAVLAAQSSLRNGVVAVARFKWTTLLGQLPRVPTFLSKFSVTSSKGSKGMSNYTVEDVRSLVVDSLTDALGTEDFDINTPLMELGLDSLAGVEFRNRLQASVDGINLTPTLMFDYPTVPDLVEYIWSQVGPAEEEELHAVQAGASLDSQLTVAGHSGRFPGSLSNHPGDFWRTLASGLDTTADLPPERWDMDAFFDPDPDTPGKTYVRLGHFILGIDQFDGEFFGLSEMEQRGMDPHQWLTLEITYDSMFAAGLTKETMNGLECGIYVGCATLGGIAPDIPAFGPFTNIGYAYSGLSGRVSHTLSLRGPCFTVDTACSATVVALDCASQALRLGRCRSAAASGVNLQLSAAIWVGFAKMRGLAADGNCKTFDTSADGFARGEGMGRGLSSVYIMADANATPAALLGGVATNHDGRAATITAPNGTAQQRVIRAALSERGTRPEALACLECHGTGTALGDPIEVGAQKAVYGKGREAPMILAAGKTNLGHLEGAAGVAGLSKAVLLLQKAQVTPLLWLKQLNHNVELSSFGFAPTELLDATRAEGRAAVSSFGFSGTNGHVGAPAILEVSRSEAPADRPRRPAACYSRRHLQPYRQWLKAPSSGQACLAVAVNGLKTNPHGADSAQTHCFLNVPITLRSRCIWRRRCIAKRIGRRRRIAKTRWEAKKHRDDASQGEDTLRRRIGNAHGFRIRIAKRRSSQVLKRDKAAIPVFRARMRTDTHGSRKSFDRV